MTDGTSVDDSATTRGPGWWRTAAIYQVYLRSFADGDGDGIGDLAGLRSRLGYLADLGADAVWISPWYPSPMADAGYDVADPRNIAPVFGTLTDAGTVVADAHGLGMRVLIDIVPNHTSSEHPVFRAALAGDPAARRRYFFRPGRGTGGDVPPNNWTSHFGGSAWTRTAAPDGRPGDWYLHLFAAGQPDLDWSEPAVVEDFADVLRFWFDRGVDGFRIDSANGLVKAPDLPDAPDPAEAAGHPAWDQDGVHGIYRGWRAIADSYEPPRVLVAEAWVEPPERLARYLRPDELHTAFRAALIDAPFRAPVLRRSIEEAITASGLSGTPPTWVLSNHDTVRHVTRYARSQPPGMAHSTWDRLRWHDESVDLELGLARGRAAALMALALPGTAFVYQGDELGLAEVEDLPDDVRQDPTWSQSGHRDPGRDGCRVPLPWSGRQPPFGFSPGDAARPPWLPQPASWSDSTAEAQTDRACSTLSLYRSALALRRRDAEQGLGLCWLDEGDDVVAFRVGRRTSVTNAGSGPVELPAGQVVLTSGPLAADGRLPGATTAWLRTDPA